MQGSGTHLRPRWHRSLAHAREWGVQPLWGVQSDDHYIYQLINNIAVAVDTQKEIDDGLHKLPNCDWLVAIGTPSLEFPVH